MKKLIFLCTLLVTGLLVMWLILGPLDDGGSANQVTIGGDFALTNQHGKAVSSDDLQGKFRVMYFGFTHCPSICPYDMEALTDALTLLSEQERAQIASVFISIDPARDTPQRLQAFLSQFHPDIIGLTGSEADIQLVQKAYHVFAQKNDEDGDLDDDLYDMNHTAFFYLMDKNGHFLRHVDHAPNPHDLADILRTLLRS